jgi:hypothetical protein
LALGSPAIQTLGSRPTRRVELDRDGRDEIADEGCVVDEYAKYVHGIPGVVPGDRFHIKMLGWSEAWESKAFAVGLRRRPGRRTPT